MKHGEVMSAAQVLKYLQDQLDQVKAIVDSGAKFVIAYPEKCAPDHDYLIDGFRTVYLPVKLLYQATFKYKSKWHKEPVVAKAVLAKPLIIPEGCRPPEGIDYGTVVKSLATDGTYVFARIEDPILKKQMWKRLGERVKQEEKV